MTIGIDMVGTNLGSGTKTYNLSFCKHLNKLHRDEKIYVFLSNYYYDDIKFFNNPTINYFFDHFYIFLIKLLR